MRRKRNSNQKASKKEVQVFDENTERISSSITDLSGPIFIDILLKLPVKRIIVCKSVCKTWYNLITDPEFGKLHFAQAEVCPLIRTLDSRRVSRMLYLVERESFENFEVGDCMCDNSPIYVKCDRHVNAKLDTRLKIPLRNAEAVMNKEDHVAKASLAKSSSFKRKRCIQLKPKDHKFKIVNSCNGFLCLSEPSKFYPLAVCNPVTGEYMDIPTTNYADEIFKDYIHCGFGFDTRTKQYKVVKMSRYIGDYGGKGATIHTLGTGLWKPIDIAPFKTFKLTFPTYLNGCIYWLSLGYKSSSIIVSFKFESEQFQSIPPPPFEIHDLDIMRNMSMGVLRGCVCIVDASEFDPIDIWVMKESGNPQSWTKDYSIDTTLDRWPYGLYQPMSYLKNGAPLMFHYPTSAFIGYDPEKENLKYIKICGIKSQFEAIAHIPSLISLKDAVVGDNVAVLNIKARCGELKLPGETKAVFIEEEDRDMASDWNSSPYDSDE